MNEECARCAQLMASLEKIRVAAMALYGGLNIVTLAYPSMAKSGVDIRQALIDAGIHEEIEG